MHKKAEDLLDELNSNPVKFAKQGKPYVLLQEYFKGFDIETLRPLLRSENEFIRSAGTYIVSELGKIAHSLLNDIIPLIRNTNISIKYEALESIMLCTTDDSFEQFVFVPRAMNDINKMIRILAMELTSNANEYQVSSAILVVKKNEMVEDSLHLTGLTSLLDCIKNRMTLPIIIQKMLDEKQPISQKYGAILAKKMYEKFPELIKRACDSTDKDARYFAKEFMTEIKHN